MIDKITHFSLRILFAVAAIFLVLGVWDRIINSFGWCLSWLPTDAWRLIEFAAILLLIVITILLRQIRETLIKSTKS